MAGKAVDCCQGWDSTLMENAFYGLSSWWGSAAKQRWLLRPGRCHLGGDLEYVEASLH